MLIRHMSQTFSGVLCSTLLLMSSAIDAYENNQTSPYYYSNYSQPQYQRSYQDYYYGTKPIAQSDFKGDYRGRTWDWDYKESWRENKNAFYRGENQSDALQEDFRYQRPPGIGRQDDAYWLDPQFFRRPIYDYQQGNRGYTQYSPYSSYYDSNYYGRYPYQRYDYRYRGYSNQGYNPNYRDNSNQSYYSQNPY